MKDFLMDRGRYIEEQYRKLSEIDNYKIEYKNGSKWSIKEIIGHLVDSASNNHQRFIRAQFTDELVCPGYDQDEWVKIQNYQNSEWITLLDCWRSFNLVIINSILNIPPDKLDMIRKKHNLDLIGWKTVDKNSTTTLDYFIRDYYGHMEYHINRIYELLKSIPLK